MSLPVDLIVFIAAAGSVCYCPSPRRCSQLIAAEATHADAKAAS